MQGGARGAGLGRHAALGAGGGRASRGAKLLQRVADHTDGATWAALKVHTPGAGGQGLGFWCASRDAKLQRVAALTGKPTFAAPQIQTIIF